MSRELALRVQLPVIVPAVPEAPVVRVVAWVVVVKIGIFDIGRITNAFTQFTSSDEVFINIFYDKIGDEYVGTQLIFYSQIQANLKNSTISQEARFKVAKTSYYKGDFKWAESQLKILKASTSQLIANDALDLKFLFSYNLLNVKHRNHPLFFFPKMAAVNFAIHLVVFLQYQLTILCRKI